MTGNTVLLGIAVGQGRWVDSGRIGLAVLSFVGGAVGGALLLGRRCRIGHALAVGAILLLVALGTWVALARREVGVIPGPAALPLIVLLSAAMGIQSATVRRVGEQRVATTYVTGTLTNLAVDVASAVLGRSDPPQDETRDAAQPRSALPLLGGLWLAYVGGALIGGFFQHQWTFFALAVPAIVLISVTAGDLRGKAS